MIKNLFVLFVLLATSIYSQSLLVPDAELVVQTINASDPYDETKFVLTPVTTELCWDGNCNLQVSAYSTNSEIILTGSMYTDFHYSFQTETCDDDNEVEEPSDVMRIAKYKLEVFVLGLDDWESKGFVYYDNRDCAFVGGCEDLAASDCWRNNDITVRFNFDDNKLYMFNGQNSNPSLDDWTEIMSPGNSGYEINWWEVKDCSYHLELDFAGDPDTPTGFSVTGDVDEHPQLSWNSNDDTDLDGYKIYYKLGSSIYYYLTTLDKTYNSFTDNGVIISDGRFDPFACYKISAVDLGDNESDKTAQDCVQYDAISKEGNSKLDSLDQKDYKLYQAFPNPFNPSTEIKFYVPYSTHVTIVLFNSIGEVITEMINSNFEKGLYSFTFDGSKLSSGIYYYRMTTPNYSATKKIQLVK